MADFYAILGVPTNATLQQIKDRYRFLAHAYHPDKFASVGHKDQAGEVFKSINEAFETLKGSDLRSAYDRQRARASTQPRSAAPEHSIPPQPSPPPKPAPPPEPVTSHTRPVVFLKPGVIAALLFAVVVVLIHTLNTRQPGVSGSQARTLELKSTTPVTVAPATTTQVKKTFDPDAYLKEYAPPSNAPAEEFDRFKAGAIPVDAQQAPGAAQQTNAPRYDALLADFYFMYGSAIVRFQGDRVVSWSNSGGKLKAQLAPAP